MDGYVDGGANGLMDRQMDITILRLSIKKNGMKIRHMKYTFSVLPLTV